MAEVTKGWFGFSVDKDRFGDDLWSVSLPHQCDEWNISTPDEADRYAYGGGGYALSHDVMVATMERFIAEATEALDALKNRTAQR